jgi:hypothetical protein
MSLMRVWIGYGRQNAGKREHLQKVRACDVDIGRAGFAVNFRKEFHGDPTSLKDAHLASSAKTPTSGDLDGRLTTIRHGF